ncbi:MAG: glycosyltransferase 87 family protein [Cytophagales bacterium]|nr:glycosyltransferase 87 family protein [Cytophagales bacterium]
MLYALNPLAYHRAYIGNLHFEGLVLFFILVTVYALGKQKVVQSAAYIALAIATKLVPIIFLPALLRAQGFKNALKYGLFVIVFSALLLHTLIESTRISTHDNQAWDCISINSNRTPVYMIPFGITAVFPKITAYNDHSNRRMEC